MEIAYCIDSFFFCLFASHSLLSGKSETKATASILRKRRRPKHARKVVKISTHYIVCTGQNNVQVVGKGGEVRERLARRRAGLIGTGTSGKRGTEE